MENIIEFIANIEDSRQQAKIRYTVTEIIIIVLFAMLGDANEWEEIEAFAKVHENCLREYIPLKNGIPSHGRIETRNYDQINDIKWLACRENWKGLNSIGTVETLLQNGDTAVGDVRL